MTPRDRAAGMVARIADALDKTGTAGWSSTSSLYYGHPGVAVLHSELARHDERHRAAAHFWITRAARMSTATQDHGLYDGTAALCFAMHQNAFSRGDYANALGQADRLVTEAANRRAAQVEQRGAGPEHHSDSGTFDTVRGLTGLGALTLARGQRAATDTVLAALEIVIRPPWILDGRPGWWVVEPSDSSSGAPENGHATLGTAHGIAGPLSLFALAWLDGHRSPAGRRSIETVAEWLMAHVRTDRQGPWWPARLIPDGIDTTPPPASWCYGVPGIARALHLAGRALGVPTWNRMALAAFRATIDRVRDEPVDGLGLCHGWAGLLHLTWRMADDTGDSALRAALDWLAARLLDRTASTLRAEFPTEEMPQLQDETRRDDHDGAGKAGALGLFTGLTGVALALHTYARDRAPQSRWDRALLVA